MNGSVHAGCCRCGSTQGVWALPAQVARGASFGGLAGAGIGALAAAVVCWWPLGRVANVHARRLLRSFAIALGVTPTAVSGGYIGFILPAALELYDGVAHANAHEILKSGVLIIVGTLMVWVVLTAAAWAISVVRRRRVD